MILDFYHNLSCIFISIRILMNCMAYSTSDTFSTINNMSVSCLILLLSFIRLLATLILVQQENEQGRVLTFQDTHSERCQIHQPAIMYFFEHTNHNIHLNVLFQNLYKLYLRACNLHQYCFPCLGDFKNLIFR